MPALNFQKQFASAVELGQKSQTIRAPRKRPFQVGDTLYLYTGMRTKVCRKLGEVKCTGVWSIRIERNNLIVDDVPYKKGARNMVATQDGFDNFEGMADWFLKTHGLPFDGTLIQWVPVLQQQATK